MASKNVLRTILEHKGGRGMGLYFSIESIREMDNPRKRNYFRLQEIELFQNGHMSLSSGKQVRVISNRKTPGTNSLLEYAQKALPS